MCRFGILEHRWRPEQQPVHDAEHGSVGADAEGKREHHRRREPGLGSQPAQGVAEVLFERVEGHGSQTRTDR
jgi:hypothetical protein